MPKENNKERLIIFCYATLVFLMISEPFIFQITNKEPIRMYGYLLFLIGAIVLVMILKREVKNKNELQIYKKDDMQST